MSAAGLCACCFPQPPAFDGCIAAYIYRYPIDLMIKKIKYQARLDLIQPLSETLIDRVRLECVELPECLVPVPLHQTRFRQRGFNQAQEIVRALVKKLALPIASGRLKRHKATTQQYDLSPAQRKINVYGAFSVVKSMSCKRIALVDDVVTTGATAAELASLLKHNGAEHVQIWSLAQAPPGRQAAT